MGQVEPSNIHYPVGKDMSYAFIVSGTSRQGLSTDKQTVPRSASQAPWPCLSGFSAAC
jgi:hypothetical protein